MANPQTEEGFTKIANEIMDALCRTRISGMERQVLDAIFRKTYGWNKCEDMIALSQFVEMTGISKPNIIHSIKKLLSKNIITVVKNDNKSQTYKFIKDYHQWRALSKMTKLSILTIPVVKNDNKSLSILSTTKDTIQNTLLQNTIAVEKSFPNWLPVKTFFEYNEQRKKKIKPKSLQRFFNKLEQIMKTTNSTAEEILDQSIVNGWEGIFPVKNQIKSQQDFNGGKCYAENKE